MPHTSEQKKRRREVAGDEGRTNDAARKKRQYAEEAASRKKIKLNSPASKPVDDDETMINNNVSNELQSSERSRLYRLIKSRVTRLADLDIAADDASLDKLNLTELDDLKKLLDKHLERASSQNFLPITIF
jgi:hypothetical protein